MTAVKRAAAVGVLLRAAAEAVAASSAGPKVVAAITAAAVRTAIIEAGLTVQKGFSPEVCDRLQCMAPVLQADLEGELIPHVVRLRRNVAAHKPALPGGFPVSAMTPEQLRKVQRGRRSGRRKRPNSEESTDSTQTIDSISEAKMQEVCETAGARERGTQPPQQIVPEVFDIFTDDEVRPGLGGVLDLLGELRNYVYALEARFLLLEASLKQQTSAALAEELAAAAVEKMAPQEAAPPEPAQAAPVEELAGAVEETAFQETASAEPAADGQPPAAEAVPMAATAVSTAAPGSTVEPAVLLPESAGKGGLHPAHGPGPPAGQRGALLDQKVHAA